MIEQIKKSFKTLFGQELCPICGNFYQGILCPSCFDELKKLFEKGQKRRLCRFCGKVLVTEKDICCDCRQAIESGESLYFPEGATLFAYKNFAKEAIRVFKFKNERSFGEIFALFAGDLLESMKQTHVLVPVPGNRANVARRGWDPAAVVADALAQKGFHTAVLLERKRHTVSLKRLSREERLLRAGNCYRLRSEALVSKRIVLIDDVRTTGSTVNRCARLLTDAGAEEVRFLVIASA